MTESEWLDCTDPQPMLEFLKGKASDRKLRLFGGGCCRRIWHLLPDDRHRRAIEVAEKYADDSATTHELQAAGGAAVEATWELKDEQDARWPASPDLAALLAAEAAEMAAWITKDQTDVWGASGGYSAWEAARLEGGGDWQCALLHDIFGNPFHAITLDPTWLTPTVKALAQSIYDDRTFDWMPFLADELVKSGCNDGEILSHCRGPGPHVMGCWALDVVLGRE
jgi:hypothetical protein